MVLFCFLYLKLDQKYKKNSPKCTTLSKCATPDGPLGGELQKNSTDTTTKITTNRVRASRLFNAKLHVSKIPLNDHRVTEKPIHWYTLNRVNATLAFYS